TMLSRRLTPALVALVTALLARSAAADTAGFAFLKIPAGARASGLGGAYAALAEGVEGAWWNPAALEGAKGVQVLASHDEYLASLRHDQFGVAGRMFGGGVSASIRALYSEPIEERDAVGNLIGSFGSHDLQFGLGYGRAIAPGWRIGASAQAIRERIADASAGTWSVGFGTSWDPARLSGLRLSADVHDLGPSGKFTIDGTPGQPVALPAAFRLGAALARPMGGLTARGALESSMISGQAGIVALGAEVAHPSGFALRGGLRWGDTESSYALGAGWSLKALRLDYAFVPFKNDLGDTHRFTLATQF
ncbi:MAG: PorV/PorQ family protein, partial [Candidatus Eiseniibacteriota bacterium]